LDSPSVAIVILNWNGKKYLEKFLPSILNTTYSNARIVIADNGSTDDSIAFVNSIYPSITVLKNPVNEGFAKGYNTALKQVQADYYILLNSDVEVTPGWIEPMVELLENNHDIGACQPKLLDLNTQVVPVDGWMHLATHSVKEGYSMTARKTSDSIICANPYSGPVAPHCSSGPACFTRPEDLIHSFLHTRKRSTCVGEFS
jgi:glycosyltransferase involved in cell wall biosynthesis